VKRLTFFCRRYIIVGQCCTHHLGQGGRNGLNARDCRRLSQDFVLSQWLADVFRVEVLEKSRLLHRLDAFATKALAQKLKLGPSRFFKSVVQVKECIRFKARVIY
jgi:hypothetical protein